MVHSLFLRQVRKYEKKHEIWFILERMPYCFLLRKFSLVTKLNCEAFPKKKKLKKIYRMVKSFGINYEVKNNGSPQEVDAIDGQVTVDRGEV